MLSRDIRLTERQLYYGRAAIKRRVRELEKRLERTSYEGKPRMKESVVNELRELSELHRILDHNFRQLGRDFAARIMESIE